MHSARHRMLPVRCCCGRRAAARIRRDHRCPPLASASSPPSSLLASRSPPDLSPNIPVTPSSRCTTLAAALPARQSAHTSTLAAAVPPGTTPPPPFSRFPARPARRTRRRPRDVLPAGHYALAATIAGQSASLSSSSSRTVAPCVLAFYNQKLTPNILTQSSSGVWLLPAHEVS